jgi:urease gamma subunit
MSRVVLLVEGESDRLALTTLAARRDLDLAGRGVEVVVMDGVTNIGRHLVEQVRAGSVVGGLYDAAEQHFVRRGLERVGLRREGSPDPLAEQGFFVCVTDLEDELVRAIGTPGVLEVLAGEEELDSFRLFQRQPAQRDRSLEAQLHRFLGTRSGRKARYGRLLAEAVPLGRVPVPLDGALAWAREAAAARS